MSSDSSPVAPVAGPPRTQAPPTMIRPEFVVAPGPAGAPAGGPTGAGPAFEFFGPTVIAAPLVAGPGPGADVQAEKDYIFAVGDVYSYWRNQYILGPASSQASPFIATDTAALVRRAVSGRPGARLGVGGGPLQRRPVALRDAINVYRRVLLLGGPGAGKTSYLQYLALLCTDGTTFPGLLPVLVDLSAYSDRGPFLAFLQDFLRTPPNPAPPEPPIHVVSPWLAGNLEGCLQRGHILLLLDGLNEIPAESPAARDARRRQIQAFFAAYPQVRAVVNCRTLDYEKELDSAGFQTVLLDPWTPEQMAAYLQERGDAFLLGRLQAGDPLLLSLGQVPFLLYMLSELSANYVPPNGTSAAPQFLTSQSEMFKQFVDILLDWATLKDPENGALFPRQAVITALARLAAAMQAVGARGTPVAYDWATAQVAPDPAALFGGVPAPATLIGDPREHLLSFCCGATILDTPATRDTIRFWHLTHQDYFAAVALADPTITPATLSSMVLTPATDTVTSLAATLAPQPAAAIAGLMNSNDPRAALVAAKALIGAGGA